MNELLVSGGDGEYRLVFRTDSFDNCCAVEEYCASIIRDGKARNSSVARVLSIDEVKDIGYRQYEEHEVEPVWLEAWAKSPGTGYVLYMALLSYDKEEEAWNEPGDTLVYTKFFGTDLDDTFYPEDYGRHWRCWTAKPTDEQRKTTEWKGEL